MIRLDRGTPVVLNLSHSLMPDNLLPELSKLITKSLSIPEKNAAEITEPS